MKGSRIFSFTEMSQELPGQRKAQAAAEAAVAAEEATAEDRFDRVNREFVVHRGNAFCAHFLCKFKAKL